MALENLRYVFLDLQGVVDIMQLLVSRILGQEQGSIYYIL